MKQKFLWLLHAELRRWVGLQTDGWLSMTILSKGARLIRDAAYEELSRRLEEGG